ncbi:MAG: 2-phosphosulfolactate phosphatase [Phycisphaerales bacterium]
MPSPDLPPAPDFSHVPRPVRVVVHADHIDEDEFRGSVAVVLDVLRATSTIVTALANGAKSFHVCLTVEEARQRAVQLGPRTLLGGERGGVLIPGFDLDNSPLSFSRERVEGRDVVFTTANGTAALLKAGRADEVYVGSLLNAQAVSNRIASDPRPVIILCSGTRSQISLDDCIGGGAIAARLLQSGRRWGGDDGLRLCASAYEAALAHGLVDALAESRGGVNLRTSEHGQRDLEWCARENTIDLTPRFNPATLVVSA